MIGPFEQYPQIHRMKQQMHISELELKQKLERQHKKNYISPQNSHLGFAWNGFRLGVGLRLDGLWKRKQNGKLSAAKSTGKTKEETDAIRNQLPPEQTKPSEPEQIYESDQRESDKEQFHFQIEDAHLTELQKAVLWAEVLGEPVSRKRRRSRSR